MTTTKKADIRQQVKDMVDALPDDLLFDVRRYVQYIDAVAPSDDEQAYADGDSAFFDIEANFKAGDALIDEANRKPVTR